ncbi:MAG: DNA polymerase III subunit delta [Lachnospiraceae bacterium]|nr:DNA polymerase III subunit delta [Lachnospiraceae bacterium]
MKSLMEDIKTGQFRPVYLLYGEEAYLKNQYKKRLRDAIIPEGDEMNYSAWSGKGIDVKQVIEQAETMPFFAERRLILIEESGFFKNACPELADYLPQMPSETILLFVESEVDKRQKMFKKVKELGRVVEMGRQNERTLTSWVSGRVRKEGKTMDPGALALFFQKTGDDMEHISRELDKLLSYTLERSSITTADVEAVCTETLENRIFEMINAMIQKQQRRALDLYYDLLALKEPPMRILYLIARQFNQMLVMKNLREQGLDNKEIASRLGVNPYAVKPTLAQASHFSSDVLQQTLTECVEAETAVKTGRMSDQMAVELQIVKISEMDAK